MLKILLCVAALGCCDSRSYETRREAQVAIAEALCARAAECGSITDSAIDRCIADMIDHACDAIDPDENVGDCEEAPRATNVAIDDCVDALNELSCTAQNLPYACGLRI